MGMVLVVLITGGVGGWAATTEISGAVIAPGALVVDSNVKKVQHPTGGIVGEILVRNGDHVRAGDVLLRLDPTISKASLSIIKKRLIELGARRTRLEAERDGMVMMKLPEALAKQYSDPAVAHVIDGEKKLFSLRQSGRIGQKSQLRQRISQLNDEIRGLMAQAKAKSKEIALIERELKGTRELWNKNLIPISKLTALEREATRIEGERAQLTSTVARVKGRIVETELQIIQIDRDFATEVANELREMDANIGEFVERKVAAEDQLKRIDIRAPQTGTVHESAVHTVGGVINSGEAIMVIVPKADGLTVEAKVAPQDIDQLSLDQTAMLRFSAFNQRTTPEISGKVSRISADVTTDERSGDSYYTVRIAMTADEVRRLGDVKLVPGMPVEVFIKTGDRKVISYLVKPLSDQITRAFRDK